MKPRVGALSLDDSDSDIERAVHTNPSEVSIGVISVLARGPGGVPCKNCTAQKHLTSSNSALSVSEPRLVSSSTIFAKL